MLDIHVRFQRDLSAFNKNSNEKLVGVVKIETLLYTVFDCCYSLSNIATAVRRVIKLAGHIARMGMGPDLSIGPN
jgi:hypothetical protein